MPLNEHMMMLNAMRVTYAAYWKVYAHHGVIDTLTEVEQDVDAMYDAYLKGSLEGFTIADAVVRSFIISPDDLTC